jgi:hypothetical protein
VKRLDEDYPPHRRLIPLERDLIQLYLAHLERLVKIRESQNAAEEEICLDDLDRVWWRMTKEQQDEVEDRLVTEMEKP